MKEFKTYVQPKPVEATVSSWNISVIVQKEAEKLLGGTGRFIENGVVKEHDYRFNGADIIRYATQDETELWHALIKTMIYFQGLE